MDQVLLRMQGQINVKLVPRDHMHCLTSRVSVLGVQMAHIPVKGQDTAEVLAILLKSFVLNVYL